VQNSVRAYCLALLSDAAYFRRNDNVTNVRMNQLTVNRPNKRDNVSWNEN